MATDSNSKRAQFFGICTPVVDSHLAGIFAYQFHPRNQNDCLMHFLLCA